MDITCTFAWIGNGLIIVAFLWLALKSNLLRDRCDNTNALMNSASGQPLSQVPRSYSLSRTQMAVWTVVIACSMIYLYFCRGCTETEVNGTALALMGISVATTAAAGLVDSSQIQAVAANPALPSRHQNQGSSGFFYDILSDENGICLHRFQHVVWTLISISIYLWQVAKGSNQTGGCLPDLDPTLLALQGISSAGYIGLKTQENQGNPTAAVPPATPTPPAPVTNPSA